MHVWTGLINDSSGLNHVFRYGVLIHRHVRLSKETFSIGMDILHTI